jgi:hypothetical protein
MSKVTVFVPTMLAAFATFQSLASAATAPGAAKYDLNGNGLVDRGVEMEVYLRHLASPILKEFDTNINGVLDAAEAQAINAQVESSDALVLARVDVEDKLGVDPGLKVIAGPLTSKLDPQADTSGILIRKSYEPISAFTMPGKFASAGAANFSFKHDFTSGNDSGIASGIIEAYQHWNVNTDYSGDIDALRSTRAALHGGIEFDEKLDQKNPSKKLDIITARAGGEVEFSGGLFDAQYWRAGLADTTDSHLDTHVGAVEFEWEPVMNSIGIGNARRIGSLPISYRWRPVVHGEYREVLGSGGDSALHGQDNALFLGPIISTELWVEEGLFAGLYVDASYRYFFDINGTDDLHYFDIGAGYNLDDAGHFVLNARYRNGHTPKGDQRVEDVTIGLGIKF